MSLTKVSYSMIEGAPINPLDFGAVGNGVADDTAALNAALTSASSLRRPLAINGGTYKTTGPLNVSSNTTIVGAASAAILYTNQTCGFKLDTVSDVSISGLIIDGQANTSYVVNTGNPFGIYINAGINVRIYDNEIKRCYRIGVSVGQTVSSNRVWIQNNFIHDIGYAADSIANYGNGVAVVFGSNIWIENNHIANIYGTGAINIEPNTGSDDCSNIYILNNRIESTTSGAHGIQFYLGVPKVATFNNIIIAENILSGVAGNAIRVNRSGNVKIVNNFAQDNLITVVNNNGSEALIDNNLCNKIAANGYGFNKVTNNTVTDSNAVGIYVEDDGTTGAMTIVANNFVKNPSSHGIQTRGRNFQITGNQIYSVGQGGAAYGITANGATLYALIDANSLTQITGTCTAFVSFQGTNFSETTYGTNMVLPTTVPLYDFFNSGSAKLFGVMTNGSAPDGGSCPFGANVAWSVGNVINKSNPISGGPPGFVCTTAGTPGTWKAMANLA